MIGREHVDHRAPLVPFYRFLAATFAVARRPRVPSAFSPTTVMVARVLAATAVMVNRVPFWRANSRRPSETVVRSS
jgi:hypothetical protein